MPTHATLQNCFREALALSADAAIETLSYQATPAWDSVGHMRLVAAIETAFNIMFTTDQILDLSSFAKAQDIVRSHGVSFES
jgi:acyl carrier protein